VKPQGKARKPAGKLPALPLWKRALLALASLLVTSLLLEGATRLFLAPPTPVELREGIYVHQLPLVNGRQTVPGVRGRPLAEQKRPGETRIFVFGESSVEGGPWGYFGGPVTMLRDQLHASFPDRDLTVVNMGRGAATTMDAYYFLVTIERFAPDLIVFYQGGNDFFSTDRERCLPSEHPRLHAAFRWLVEHSRLVWTMRAQGPSFFARWTSPPSAGASAEKEVDLCDDGAGFSAWAELLVATAKRMTPNVIVATPVQNPLRWAEPSGRWGVEQRLDVQAKSEPYKRLLGCVLDERCDLVATWAHELVAGRYHSPWVDARREAWRRAATERSASFIDVGADFAQHAEGGLRPPLFSDEVHLTFEGYWRLAWLWSRAVEPMLGAPVSHPDAPPPLDRPRYLAAVMRHGRKVGACFLLGSADVYLRADMPLIAASILRLAVAFEAQLPGEPARSRAGLVAQLLLGTLRRDLGLDPSLPPALAPRLASLDRARVSAELREHPDCSTVGGPDLPAAPDDNVVDDGNAYVIPGGQEGLITDMLGRSLVSPDGCVLDQASVPGTFVRAHYRCPDGKRPSLELHHPSVLLPAIATTERFLIRAGDEPPSPALLQALVATLRAKEGAFVWKRDGPPQSVPAPPEEASTSSSRGPLLLAFALAAALAFALLLQRRLSARSARRP
jgi:lysophospholipase L1-like esterase